MHSTLIRSIRGSWLPAACLVLVASSTAHADEHPAAKDAPAGQPSGEAKGKGFEIGLSAASLGAFDSNVFDKGKDPVMAAGGDVNVGVNLGVPLSHRVSWASAVGLGSNARQGIDASAGDSNALRVDAFLKTGLEILLFGETSLPGRSAKKSRLPALKLGLEAKYAYWSNPFITQPAAAADPTVDALEPTEPATQDSDAEVAAEGEAGDEGGGAEPAEAAADIPIGAQTFSNPNTHHKLTGAARLVFEASSRLTFALEGGGGRDMVKLTDAVLVSPEYNEVTADFSAKYKLSPKLLWVTLGYVFERRVFDEPNAKNLTQDFAVHGGKLVVDVPLKPLKFKLGYDLRMKSADAGSDGDTRRHQVQLGAEVPVSKAFSIVADARYTNTEMNSASSSTRFIGLAGLKAKW
jgi:hypothetical protein